MEILLHKKADIFAGCQASAEFKKALRENSGRWVNVETDYLFHDQYNTSLGRIPDSMVAAVRDDIREGLGRCRYCGAIVRKDEEDKHYLEKENGDCSGCWRYRFRRYGEKVTTEEKRIENGVEFITRKTWEEEKKVCTYNENKEHSCDCTKKECRRFGIDWFTTENTFFLRYPNGLPGSRVIFGGECLKVESYFLDFLQVGDYYRLSNSRNRLDFYIDTKKEGLRRIVKRSWGNSFQENKIPSAVKEKALAIIDFRKMILQAIINGGGTAAEFAALRNLSGAAAAIFEKFREEKDGNGDFQCFCAWLGGLPSWLSLPFATFEQKEILKNLGIKNLRRCSDLDIFNLFAGQVWDVLRSWERWGGCD